MADESNKIRIDLDINTTAFASKYKKAIDDALKGAKETFSQIEKKFSEIALKPNTKQVKSELDKLYKEVREFEKRLSSIKFDQTLGISKGLKLAGPQQENEIKQLKKFIDDSVSLYRTEAKELEQAINRKKTAKIRESKEMEDSMSRLRKEQAKATGEAQKYASNMIAIEEAKANKLKQIRDKELADREASSKRKVELGGQDTKATQLVGESAKYKKVVDDVLSGVKGSLDQIQKKFAGFAIKPNTPQTKAELEKLYNEVKDFEKRLKQVDLSVGQAFGKGAKTPRTQQQEAEIAQLKKQMGDSIALYGADARALEQAIERKRNARIAETRTVSDAIEQQRKEQAKAAETEKKFADEVIAAKQAKANILKQLQDKETADRATMAKKPGMVAEVKPVQIAAESEKFKTVIDSALNKALSSFTNIQKKFSQLSLKPNTAQTKKEMDGLVKEVQKYSKDLDKLAEQQKNKLAKGLIKATPAQVEDINKLKTYIEQSTALYKKDADELVKSIQTKKTAKNQELTGYDAFLARIKSQEEIIKKTSRDSATELVNMERARVEKLKALQEREIADKEATVRKKTQLSAQEIKAIQMSGEAAMMAYEKSMAKGAGGAGAGGIGGIFKNIFGGGAGGGGIGGILSAAFGKMVPILGAFGIITSLGQLSGALKDATASALDFAQAQYTLQVQVKAAQNVLGVTAAGTLSEWQGRIKTLQKELGIYSEISITKAISQTSVLTRVLGLNADQQQQVVQIAATLAQTTGIDLSQAVDDVTRALGGSSVVLDKYGLFIRDVDKGSAAFQLGFTDKVQKGTNTLNSQQLAMASLKVILDQTAPLFNELGGYQDSLPGRMKKLDAAITDQTIAMGESFTGLNELFKTLYLDFLKYVNDVLQQFKPLMTMIDEINIKLKREGKVSEEIGKAPILGDYLKKGYVTNDIAALSRGYEKGISAPIYERKDFLNQPEFGEAEKFNEYLRDMEEYLNKRNGLVEKYNKEERWIQYQEGGGSPKAGQVTMPTKPAVEDTALLEDQAKLTEKYGQDIVDAFRDHNKGLADALKDRNESIRKAGIDLARELQTQRVKLARELEDLAIEVGRKRGDIERDYSRKLEEIDAESGSNRAKAEADRNAKLTELHEKFLNDLRELDNQYYFDLHDAVAENDAVAIKRLERKYNLDKQKLETNLSESINQENDSFGREMAAEGDRNNNQRADALRDYQRKLEDLAIYEQEKQEDLQKSFEREQEDAQRKYGQTRQDIKTAYDQQKDDIDNAWSERLNDIGINLGKEEIANSDFLNNLLDMYGQYIGPNGMVTQMVQDFYQGMGASAIEGMSAQELYPEYVPAGYGTGGNTAGVTNNSSGSGTLSVNITADSDLIGEISSNYVGNVIQDVYVNGGVSMT